MSNLENGGRAPDAHPAKRTGCLLVVGTPIGNLGDFSPRALEALLKREHYSVDVVHNGQAALDYGLAANYDALDMELMLHNA